MAHHIEISEPPLYRFIFSHTGFAWFWVIIRVYVGWQWLVAGWEKVTSPLWVGPDAGGGGAHGDKENPESYGRPLFLRDRAHANDEYKKIIDDYDEKRSITVPSDHRAFASRMGHGEYEYRGRGGISLSIPYVAGIFALTLQVNPDLKQEEIIEMIHESAITNKKGLRIINPNGVIELARGRIKN